jgi:hypothetical protein
MKKITLFTTMVAFCFGALAQNNSKKGLQKITCGVVVPVFGSTPITYPTKTFILGYNVSPNVVFVTKNTYHNFLYGTGNNVFKTINGYKIKKEVGIYTALQKNLKNFNSSSYYVGVGIEEFIPLHQNLTFFLFSEVGINHISNKYSKVFTVGIHMNVQMPLWKRK